jgi:hypothetical protein
MRSSPRSLLSLSLLAPLLCLVALMAPRAAAADNDAATLLSLHEWPVAGIRRVRMLRCLRDPFAGQASCDLSVDSRGRAAKLLRFSEGPGLGLGSGIFHPGATLTGGYDSNVFASSDFISGAGFIELAAHLRLGQDAAPVPGQVLRYDLYAGLRFREYISDSDRVTEQRALEPTIGAALTLFPGGPVSVALHNDFARLAAHPDNGLNAALDWDRNRTSAQVAVRPGLGLILELEYAAIRRRELPGTA